MSLKNSTLNDNSILSVDPHAHSLNNTALFKEHEAVKSGYVFKRYKTRKIWKKRWMVTRGQSVFVYKNDKEYELLYHIDLSEVQAISEVNRKKKENVFGMVTLAKIFYFQALNQKEMEEWIQILKAARVNTLCQETEVAAVSRSEPIDIPSNKSSVTQPWPSSNSRPISFDPTSLSASSCSNMGSYDAFVHDSSNPRARMSDISLEAASEENSDFSLEDSPILQSSPITPDLSPPQLEMANLALESQANEPETGPRYQGFLSKKCESYKSWRTRWFVIRDGKLCYYKDDKEYEIHGMIPLQSISKVTKAISTDKSKKYCFKIISPKRNFKLCANTQADMEKWIDALNNRGAMEFGSQAVAST